MVRVVLGFLAAVVVAFVIGAASLAWFDQQAFLESGGAELSLGDRFSWFLATANGLALKVKMYPGLLAVGLLIAFVAANFAQGFAPGLRTWWYAGAGAVALLALVAGLKLALGLQGLPGARTGAGVAGQAVAGFLAGLTYAMVSKRRR